jgi:hypothetical protein
MMIAATPGERHDAAITLKLAKMRSVVARLIISVLLEAGAPSSTRPLLFGTLKVQPADLNPTLQEGCARHSELIASL